MNPLSNFLNTLNSKSKTSSSYGVSKPTSGAMVNQPQPLNMSVAPTPNMSVAPTGNSSATSPVVKNQTTTTTNLPPVATQYIDSLSKPTQNAYDAVTGARTAYGESQGLPNMLGGKAVSDKPNIPTPTAVTPPPAPKNPYQEYLDSFNKRQSNELLRNRQREDELRKNDIGQLERGQQYQMGEEERLSNRSLADLAIAKAPTLDLYNQYEEQNKPIEVGGVLYKKEADGQYTPLTGTGAGAEQFTLGKDQIRYDAQGNVIASGVGSGSGSGEPPVIKTFGQTDYAWNPQTSQWDPVQLSDISPQVKIDKAQSVIDLIKTLGSDATGFSGAVGAKGPSSLFGLKDNPIGGTDAAGYVARFNQLVGMLTLENMGIMKGVLSDSDIKIIKEASTALNRGVKEGDFVTELGKIEKVMQKVIDKGGAMSSDGTTGGGGLYDF